MAAVYWSSPPTHRCFCETQGRIPSLVNHCIAVQLRVRVRVRGTSRARSCFSNQQQGSAPGAENEQNTQLLQQQGSAPGEVSGYYSAKAQRREDKRKHRKLGMKK